MPSTSALDVGLFLCFGFDPFLVADRLVRCHQDRLLYADTIARRDNQLVGSFGKLEHDRRPYPARAAQPGLHQDRAGLPLQDPFDGRTARRLFGAHHIQFRLQRSGGGVRTCLRRIGMDRFNLPRQSIELVNRAEVGYHQVMLLRRRKLVARPGDEIVHLLRDCLDFPRAQPESLVADCHVDCQDSPICAEVTVAGNGNAEQRQQHDEENPPPDLCPDSWAAYPAYRRRFNFGRNRCAHNQIIP